MFIVFCMLEMHFMMEKKTTYILQLQMQHHQHPTWK